MAYSTSPASASAPLSLPCSNAHHSSYSFLSSYQFSRARSLHLLMKGLRTRNPHLPPKIQFIRQSKAEVVTKDSWEKSVLNSEIPVLVEFFANWCGPCRMVHRVIDEIAAEYAGKLNCFQLNTDNDLQIAEDYEIKVVPVVLLFKNGKKYDTVIGTMPKEFYVTCIERVLVS